jgi:hypothetical protein
MDLRIDWYLMIVEIRAMSVPDSPKIKSSQCVSHLPTWNGNKSAITSFHICADMHDSCAQGV